jgi:sodium/hydrogen exchanger 10/11
VLLCLFFIIALGAGVKHLFSFLPIPYTVILSIIGVIMAAICDQPTDDFQEAVIRFSNIDAHLILYVFLPPLLFESAFNMDVNIFFKVFKQVLLLAGPGLMVATFITGYLSWLVFGGQWRFVDALLFGAISSATDPVAVVALLNDLGAPKQLGHMIEGESLLNDGTAIVLYSVIIEVVQDSRYLEAQGPHGIIWVFIKMAVGGVLLGLVLSSIAIAWIRRVFNDPMTEISITLAFTYLTFFIAEHICGFSGVMAVVAFGLHLNKNRLAISPEVGHFLHEFWTMIGHLANTVIFVLIGLILFLQNSEALSSPVKWGNLMLIYVIVTFSRVVCFALFYPLLKKMGYGFTWQEGVVAVWGGLRGAVGLALALGSKHALANTPGGLEVYKDLLFYVSGIVLLTLVVNGTTMKHVVVAVGLDGVDLDEYLALKSVAANLSSAADRYVSSLKVSYTVHSTPSPYTVHSLYVSSLKRNPLFCGSDFQLVASFLPKFEFPHCSGGMKKIGTLCAQSVLLYVLLYVYTRTQTKTTSNITAKTNKQTIQKTNKQTSLRTRSQKQTRSHTLYGSGTR